MYKYTINSVVTMQFCYNYAVNCQLSRCFLQVTRCSEAAWLD